MVGARFLSVGGEIAEKQGRGLGSSTRGCISAGDTGTNSRSAEYGHRRFPGRASGLHPVGQVSEHNPLLCGSGV